MRRIVRQTPSPGNAKRQSRIVRLPQATHFTAFAPSIFVAPKVFEYARKPNLERPNIAIPATLRRVTSN
jgi:hypothetical protein